MSISRVYQAIPLTLASRVQLDEQASHHLARVLRASVGDQLTVFNGEGGEYTAVIAEINKKQVVIDILQFVAREAESYIDIYLAQGIARGEKMDHIIQKAVELGVTKIIPLITERCNVRLDAEREEKRVQHWRSVIISACEQSGRNRIPDLSAPATLQSWLPQVQADKCFVLSPHVQETLRVEKLPAHARVVILVGPEGGLSDQEVAMTVKQGFIPLKLGSRVLRTETAGIAALSVLQYAYGDLG